jgi:carbon-monoxide dehydrogenase small subunit
MTTAFSVNGRAVSVPAPGLRRLLDVLREDLGLTGTKEGCGEGECGACSVLVDGAVVASCLVPVCQVEGAEVSTVEGLADGDTLHVLQRAFLEHGGAQCGICTPGMLVAAKALLDARRSDGEGERRRIHSAGASSRGVGGGAPDGDTARTSPSLEEVRVALAGNLCRCTGYAKILEAVMAAAAEVRGA